MIRNKLKCTHWRVVAVGFCTWLSTIKGIGELKINDNPQSQNKINVNTQKSKQLSKRKARQTYIVGVRRDAL